MKAVVYDWKRWFSKQALTNAPAEDLKNLHTGMRYTFRSDYTSSEHAKNLRDAYRAKTGSELP